MVGTRSSRRRTGVLRRGIGALLAFPLLVLGFGASPAQAATHTPVVFVHGYTGSASNWTTAEALFIAAGYSSNELFAYQYDWSQSNKTSAQGLAAYVNQVKQQTGASKVDIVNHSMGGLVSDWYLHELGGTANVAHLASIAGANHGTTYAAACLTNTSCQEMYPGSSFITTVTSGDETPGATKYATWYSPCDGVIIPFTSTTLNGANNNYVLCQTHVGYLTDASVLGAVRAFLAT